MNQRENKTLKHNTESNSKLLPFLHVSNSDDLCYSIEKNLFNLERDLACFRFAIKEIKEAQEIANDKNPSSESL